MKKMIDGQMNMFDILNTLCAAKPDVEDVDVIDNVDSVDKADKVDRVEVEDGPPILLKPGDVIYHVEKGDMIPYVVDSELTWVSHRDGRDIRCYRLFNELNGCYGVTNNELLGESDFRDLEDAKEKAQAFIDAHQVIRAEDIYPISIEAYQYVRKFDQRTMTAFWCELPGGKAYVREFHTYAHIISSTKNTHKAFMDDVSKVENLTEVADYEPKFKNMYRCNGQTDWLYAESGYTFAKG